MKNIKFFFIFFTFCSFVYSDNTNVDEKWLIRMGTRNINNFPIKSIFQGFFMKKNNSFHPIISDIGVGYDINKHIDLSLDASLGLVDHSKWNQKDSFLIQYRPGLNFYPFFKHKYKIDPYLTIGSGLVRSDTYLDQNSILSKRKLFRTNRKDFFFMDSGVGVNFWINSNIGINAQSTYNHLIAKESNLYIELWKHYIGLIFRFNKFSELFKDRNIKVLQKNKEEQDTQNMVKFDKKMSYYPLIVENKELLREDKPDSDRNGVLDEEVFVPKKFGLKKFQGCPKIIFQSIFFNIGKHSLSNYYIFSIEKIAYIMKNIIPNSKFYIDGYADYHGRDNMNKILSNQRTKAVYHLFLRKGIHPSRIETRVFIGKKYAKKGRRVDIILNEITIPVS